MYCGRCLKRDIKSPRDFDKGLILNSRTPQQNGFYSLNLMPSLKNVDVEILMPQVMVLEDGASGRCVGHYWSPCKRTSALTEGRWREKLQRDRPLAPLSCEARSRRHKALNRKEGHHQKMTMLVPWPWTSQPLKLWEKRFCCLEVTKPVVFVIAALTD